MSLTGRIALFAVAGAIPLFAASGPAFAQKIDMQREYYQ